MLPARLWLPLVIAVAISIATAGADGALQPPLLGHEVEIGAGLTLRTKILQLEKSIIEAETAQRGYLLTRKDTYLEPFQRSLESIRPLQREILDLMHDEKAERDKLTDLNALIALEARRDGAHGEGGERARTSIARWPSSRATRAGSCPRSCTPSFASLNTIVSAADGPALPRMGGLRRRPAARESSPPSD